MTRGQQLPPASWAPTTRSDATYTEKAGTMTRDGKRRWHPISTALRGRLVLEAAASTGTSLDADWGRHACDTPPQDHT